MAKYKLPAGAYIAGVLYQPGEVFEGEEKDVPTGAILLGTDGKPAVDDKGKPLPPVKHKKASSPSAQTVNVQVAGGGVDLKPIVELAAQFGAAATKFEAQLAALTAKVAELEAKLSAKK